MNDKLKKHAMIGASIGLLAVFLTGCGGKSDDTAATPPATAANTPDSGTVPAGGAATSPLGTAAPATSGMQPAGQPGGVFSNTPGVTAPGKTVAANLPYKVRRDPTFIDWHVPPPPPNIFTEVQPLRIATYNVVTPPEPNTEVREIPTRRVSGIMSGDGVFAILESGTGDPEIVKPGAETSDGYKVVSINADSVKLQKKEGNLVRTQVVLLSDISTNPSAGGGMGRMGGAMGGAGGGSMGGAGGGKPLIGPSGAGSGGGRGGRLGGVGGE